MNEAICQCQGYDFSGLTGLIRACLNARPLFLGRYDTEREIIFLPAINKDTVPLFDFLKNGIKTVTHLELWRQSFNHRWTVVQRLLYTALFGRVSSLVSVCFQPLDELREEKNLTFDWFALIRVWAVTKDEHCDMEALKQLAECLDVVHLSFKKAINRDILFIQAQPL